MSEHRIIAARWQDVLPTLPNACADAIITDPPYGTTNLAWDVDQCDDAFSAECWRLLRPKGALVVFASGMFTADLLCRWRKFYRYKFVWHRLGPAAGHLDAARRPMRTHEDVLVFGKALPAYTPRRHAARRVRVAARGTSSALYGSKGSVDVYDRDYRLQTDVAAFKPLARRTRRHKTEKPVDLLRMLVTSYAKPGGLVIDPFCGSASCGEACQREGRRFIGVESDEAMAEVAT